MLMMITKRKYQFIFLLPWYFALPAKSLAIILIAAMLRNLIQIHSLFYSADLCTPDTENPKIRSELMKKKIPEKVQSVPLTKKKT